MDFRCERPTAWPAGWAAVLASVASAESGGDRKWPPPAALLEELGLSHLRLVRNRQVHGAGVRVLTRESSREEPADTPEADALLTDRDDLGLAVLVADCAPIYLLEPGRGVMGLVHAGWRGTVADVAAHTVQRMKARFGCEPARLVAWIGPCIKPRNYQVGAAVLLEARRRLPHLPVEECVYPDEKLDIAGLNRLSLLACGLRDERIEVSPLCSFETAGLQSYRRDGERAGRMFALLWKSSRPPAE